MKTLGLLLLFLIGAGLGFVGVYVCFYGGLASFITQVQANPIDSGKLAWSIIRFFLGVPCGYGTILLWLVGLKVWVE